MILDFLKKFNHSFDWLLLGAMFFISVAGILTMNSFTEGSDLFVRQIIWLAISIFALFAASFVDWRFLRRSGFIVGLFLVSCFLLLFLFIAGSAFKGAKSWFDLGAFAFQPVDFVKPVLVILLAKYFSRRHIEIANVDQIPTNGKKRRDY